MTSVEFDFSELDKLTVSIEDAAPDLGSKMVKVIRTSAYRGRQEWIKSARKNAGPHLPAYPTSVDFDPVDVADGEIFTELGPNLERNQGALGIVEDAPGGVRSKPQRNYERAEKVIEADLVKGTLIALDQSLREKGLS